MEKSKKERKILLVDDEEDVLRILPGILEEEGYKVSTARNGIEGLEKFKKERHDIVLSDIKMPGMDGIELLQKLKEIDGDVPVFMITGYPSVETAVETMRLGGLNYLFKPIDLEMLSEGIEEVLEKKSLQERNRELMEQLKEAQADLEKKVKERTEELEKISKDLAEGKDYTDNIIESMIDTLIVVDPDARIKTVNKATFDLLGYTEEELIGKPVATIFEEEEVIPFKGTMMKKLLEEGSVRDYDMTYRTKTGEKIPVIFSGSVMRDKEGELVGIVGIARDMREIKRLMQKEREFAVVAAGDRKRAEEWQNTFDSILDLICIEDKDFNIIKANKAFSEVLKVKPEDITCKKCYEIFHKSDKPWPDCPFEMTKKDKKPHTLEVNDPNIGFPLLVSVSPIFNDKGELIGAVHIAKDISEMKEVQEKLEKRMHDLEVLQNITMGREFRIAELKDENARLKKELGK